MCVTILKPKLWVSHHLQLSACGFRSAAVSKHSAGLVRDLLTDSPCWRCNEECWHAAWKRSSDLIKGGTLSSSTECLPVCKRCETREGQRVGAILKVTWLTWTQRSVRLWNVCLLSRRPALWHWIWLINIKALWQFSRCSTWLQHWWHPTLVQGQVIKVTGWFKSRDSWETGAGRLTKAAHTRFPKLSAYYLTRLAFQFILNVRKCHEEGKRTKVQQLSSFSIWNHR